MDFLGKIQQPAHTPAVYIGAVTIALHAAVTAASHVGRVRHTNQDAWSYSLDAGLFVVCDGMGGAAGGEIASQLVVDALMECLGPVARDQRTPKAITKAVCSANKRVLARAAAEPALSGMGTTLVALLACGEREVAVVHVGDSRCYRWRAPCEPAVGELVRITEDHSLIAEQMRMGLLTEAEAATAPMRHVITRAVGIGRHVEPDVQMLTAEPGDVFLLCSDGLTRELPEAGIATVLAEDTSLEVRNHALLDAALAAGGRDNVTCVLVEMGAG